jgi:hypothetical protein
MLIHMLVDHGPAGIIFLAQLVEGGLHAGLHERELHGGADLAAINCHAGRILGRSHDSPAVFLASATCAAWARAFVAKTE